MPRTLHNSVDVLRSSEKFLAWRGFLSLTTNVAVAITKHFTPAELAEAWGVSVETIRAIFRDEPGVLKIGKTGAKYKREYVTLRIPEDVAERVHTRLSA